MRKVSYELKRKNVKNINLRVTKDCKVIVSAPSFVSEEEIDKFVQSKSDFIYKHLDNYSGRNIVNVFEKDFIYLYGQKLNFKKVSDTKFSYSITSSTVILYYRNLEKDYERMLKSLAFEYFNSLGLNISEEMGLKNIEVAVKKFKSCYGKNYGKKQIALNYLLVHLDKRYVRHILYHEYAHCFEMNHSSKFYSILSKYDSNYKMNRKYIKDNFWKYC